jgi:hypothetical protein
MGEIATYADPFFMLAFRRRPIVAGGSGRHLLTAAKHNAEAASYSQAKARQPDYDVDDGASTLYHS